MEAGITSKFGTGAIRSSDAEDVRYDLISPIALEELAKTCHEGAFKYSAFNWEKGMAAHDLLNHALRHIYKFLSGDRSEPHLAHAMWNVGGAIHSLALWPHLNEGHLRGPGCTPPKEPGAGLLGSEKETPPDTLDGFRERCEAIEKIAAEQVENAKRDFDEAGVMAVLSTAKAIFGKSFPTFGPPIPAAAVQVLPNGMTTVTIDAPVAQQAQQPPAAPAESGQFRRKPVLYLSGPMSGFKDFNFPAFNAAAAQLREKGYPVINPADFGADPGETWAQALSRDLSVLGHAKILVKLPGWEKSKGACLEIQTAAGLGLDIVDFADISTLP